VRRARSRVHASQLPLVLLKIRVGNSVVIPERLRNYLNSVPESLIEFM
jgi:hypothetical protein